MRNRLAFAFHNCVMHPLCGLLWLAGADRLANRLHNATVPRTRR